MRGDDMREKIESPANKKIKLVANLAKRKNRTAEGLFIAEGIRLSEMALNSNFAIEFALYTAKLLASERGQKLLAVLDRKKINSYEVTENVYNKVSATTAPQGIMLIIKQKKYRLAELNDIKNPLYVILNNVQDPGNVGTIIRTADAVNASAVILTTGTADVYSDKTVRSTMGSIFNLPIVENVSDSEVLKFLQQNNIAAYATALDSTAKPHFLQDFSTGTAIILGNEGQGIAGTLLENSIKTYIPMYGKAESLNVGMSAAIVLYEVVRQRKFNQLSPK